MLLLNELNITNHNNKMVNNRTFCISGSIFSRYQTIINLDIVDSVEDIISWKNNVSKALWILFTAVVGLLAHLVMGK